MGRASEEGGRSSPSRSTAAAAIRRRPPIERSSPRCSFASCCGWLRKRTGAPLLCAAVLTPISPNRIGREKHRHGSLSAATRGPRASQSSPVVESLDIDRLLSRRRRQRRLAFRHRTRRRRSSSSCSTLFSPTCDPMRSCFSFEGKILRMRPAERSDPRRA